MKWQRKHLLGLEELSSAEIRLILEQARQFREVLDRPIPVVPALRGKTIVNLFYEPSTRTATSFGLAAKRLSADVVNFSLVGSSASKGETLLDTARNIEAMRISGVVVRHSAPGAPHFLARHLGAFVVNAGDGAHEHPTQGLLDIFTMQEKLGKLAGCHVLVVGDISHSRVARSDIFGLSKLGAKLAVCGPAPLIPPEIDKLGVRVYYDLDEALKWARVCIILRIQFERQKGFFPPSLRDYRMRFCLTRERVARLDHELLIMHPGPMNRGVEIEPEVADGPQSVILEQVANGVAVRMAVLYLLAGGISESRT